MDQRSESPTPVLLLDGQENTLCLARCLGSKGVPIYLSAPASCLAGRSRYIRRCFLVPANIDASDYWADLLLSAKHPDLEGSVIMTCSDIAVEFVAHYKDQLQAKYLVDDHVPQIHLSMLDKRKTLELGAKTGCPTPAFHAINVLEDIDDIIDTVMFPAMIKPLHSHIFQKHFPRKKYLTARSRQELTDNVRQMLELGLELMVTEMIPGPDDLQSSYFTYMDGNGEELFEYTHQIIRRYPKNSGNGCLHVSRRLPETAEMGKRFFQGINFRGMGHIEFKQDRRDGKLKIIECNPRFSAAQATAVKSGLDMAYIIYCHLTGKPLPPERSYRAGVRRWMVLSDFLAFRELRRMREITLLQWIQSIKGPPLVFAYFSWRDPMPFVKKVSDDLYGWVTRRKRAATSSAVTTRGVYE